MTFREAIEECHLLRDSYKPGLQAFESADRRRVEIRDSRRWRGSVDVDGATQEEYPQSSRWDYAIGYLPPIGQEEEIAWVEVHPANNGEVATVLKKLEWLRAFISARAPSCRNLEQRYHWVSSGEDQFARGDRVRAKLAANGIAFCGCPFRLE